MIISVVEPARKPTFFVRYYNPHVHKQILVPDG